jgi:hypothetical protein
MKSNKSINRDQQKMIKYTKKKKKKKKYPTSNHNPSNNWDKSSVGDPSLPLKGQQKCKQRREKGRRGADSLVEGHRKVPEGNVPTHHRRTKDNAQSRNLEELGARFDGLEGHELEEGNGNVAEDGTG